MGREGGSLGVAPPAMPSVCHCCCTWSGWGGHVEYQPHHQNSPPSCKIPSEVGRRADEEDLARMMGGDSRKGNWLAPGAPVGAIGTRWKLLPFILFPLGALALLLTSGVDGLSREDWKCPKSRRDSAHFSTERLVYPSLFI